MQKYFLILLFLYINPSAYAMENTLEIVNKTFFEAIKTAHKNGFKKNEDWEKIESCLKQSDMDLNYKFGKYRITPLALAIKYRKENLINYLLENKADINVKNSLGVSLLESTLYEISSSDEDKRIFETLLKAGINPNEKLTNKNHASALYFTITCRDNYFTKLLIEYGANVNLPRGNHTPLTWAIFTKKIEAVQELCRAKASLINIGTKGNSIFHCLAGCPKEYIETIMTHSRFDSYDKKNQIKFRQTIIGALWAFDFVGLIFNKDLKFHILSMLPIEYLFASKRLYEELLKRDYKNLFLPQVHKHIKYIEEILQQKNNKGQTVLDRLKKYGNDHYQQSVERLFSADQLKEDIKDLLHAKEQEDIPENNLALRIYNNYASLQNKYNSQNS